MLSVVMLNVVILNVDMLSVMAPMTQVAVVKYFYRPFRKSIYEPYEQLRALQELKAALINV
jgi:hypothetical protein